jgi:hypothetical protein
VICASNTLPDFYGAVACIALYRHVGILNFLYKMENIVESSFKHLLFSLKPQEYFVNCFCFMCWHMVSERIVIVFV